jgi:hypothetical protein
VDVLRDHMNVHGLRQRHHRNMLSEGDAHLLVRDEARAWGCARTSPPATRPTTNMPLVPFLFVVT